MQPIVKIGSDTTGTPPPLRWDEKLANMIPGAVTAQMEKIGVYVIGAGLASWFALKLIKK